MNKNKFFIYAGPQKTGSTWLYSVLNKHPDAEMPPIKEVNYFLNPNKSFLRKIFKNCYKRKKRQSFLWHLKTRIRRLVDSRFVDWKPLYVVLSQYFFLENDKWYLNLFSKNKLSGDISPRYSRLSEQSIRRIKELNPNTKIIIGLRDPVSRRWSAIKMKHLTRHQKTSISEIKKEALEKELHTDDFCDDYTLLLDKWSKYFPKEQLFVYYFEELKESPQALYGRICNFLEIPSVVIGSLTQNPNKGIAEKLPPEYEKMIVSVQYKYIEKFAENYPNEYSQAWLEKYKDYEIININKGVKRKRKLEKDLTLKEKKEQLKMATEYIDNVPEPKLQIGCGGNRLNGWLNTDIAHRKPDVFLMDAGKKFPFEDNTFNFIFSEHTLEHLSFKDAYNMLTECFRVLKPNGVIRIGVPHIDFLVKLYQNPEKPLHKRFIKSHLEYAYKDIVDFYGYEQIESPEVFVVNSYYKNFGHQMIHNFSTLKQLLAKANFSMIEQKEVGVSAYAEISQIERRGKKYNEEFNKLETLDVEAVKK